MKLLIAALVAAGCAAHLVKPQAAAPCVNPGDLIQASSDALADGSLLLAEARANDAVKACGTSGPAYLALARAQAELGLADEARLSATRAGDRGAAPADVQEIDDAVEKLPSFDRKPANDAEAVAADYLLQRGLATRREGDFATAVEALRGAFAYRADVGTILEIARTEEMAAEAPETAEPDVARIEARKAFARAMRFAEKTRGQTAVPQPATTISDATLAALSADGSLLASGVKSIVKIEDVRSTGQLASIQLDQSVDATALAFDPTGRLVVGDSRGAVIVYDQKGALKAQTLAATMHGAEIDRIAFDRDGKLVASGDADGRVTVRDLHDPALKVVAEYRDHIGAVSALALSADGKNIASGGVDCTVELAAIGAIADRRTLSRHTAALAGVAFRYDGALLASADGDGNIYLWDSSTGELRRSLAVDDRQIKLLAFVPGGQFLRALSGTGARHEWSTGDWTHTVRPISGEIDPEGSVHDQIAASADGSRVALLDQGILSIADLAGTKATAMVNGVVAIRQLLFAGDKLVDYGENGDIVAWPLDGSAPYTLGVHQAPLIGLTPQVDGVVALDDYGDDGEGGTVMELQISPFDTSAAVPDPIHISADADVGPRGGLLSVTVDKVEGKQNEKQNEKQDSKNEKLRSGTVTYRPFGEEPVTHRGVMAVLSTDESRLAVIAPDERDAYDLAIYSRAGALLVSRHHVADALPTRLAIDPDGRWAAVVADKLVSLFDMSKPDAAPITLALDAEDVILGPAGHVAIIERKDQKLTLGQIAGDQLVGPDPQLRHVTTVAISADGSLAAVGAGDGTVSILATDKNRLVATLLGDENRWVALAGDHVDGSDSDDGSGAGADLVVWRVGDLQLPGQSAWDRQRRPGLLGDAMRPFGLKAVVSTTGTTHD